MLVSAALMCAGGGVRVLTCLIYDANRACVTGSMSSFFMLGQSGHPAMVAGRKWTVSISDKLHPSNIIFFLWRWCRVKECLECLLHSLYPSENEVFLVVCDHRHGVHVIFRATARLPFNIVPCAGEGPGREVLLQERVEIIGSPWDIFLVSQAEYEASFPLSLCLVYISDMLVR